MANIYDLTDQPISSSFEPLLQIDSGSALRDGTGSLVDLIITTASYALTASVALNVSNPEWDNIQNKPSGLVSGSSQIILQDTIGDLSASRIDGSVNSALVATQVVIGQSSQDSALPITFANSATSPAGLVRDSQVLGLTYNPSANRLQTVNINATTVTATNFIGNLTGNADTATNATYAQNTITTGKNLHSTEIIKGTPLYFTGSGTEGNLVGVYPADAGNPSRMPAGGIAGETIAVGAEGVVLLDGYIGGVNTSAFQSGDEVFVAVGGGYTNQAPTGSALIQHLGNVEKSAINGSGVIQMMGEARGLPNIQQGYAWVGDGDGVPQAVATSSFAVSIDTGSLVTTSSFNSYTSSNDSKVQSLIVATGSYATTGSNNFFGNQDISGSISSTINESNVQLNPQVITDNITIPTGLNASVNGPITISGSYIVEGNSNVYIISQVIPPNLSPYLTKNQYNQTTGSFATTGSNTFNGNQTVNGFTQLNAGLGVSDGGIFIGDTTQYPNGGVNMRMYGTITLVSGSGIQTDGAFGPSVPFDSPVDFFNGIGLQDGPINNVQLIELYPQDPLPPTLGRTGLLSVSGSALYFYDGSTWRTVNLT